MGAAQFNLAELLERAGARPPRYARGKWQCPKHSGSPSVSVDLARGLYHCFHGGCDFQGSQHTLARQLGLSQRIPRAEYVRLRRGRARAHEAAQRLYASARQRRMELADVCRSLGRIEYQAHLRLRANHEDEDAWSWLELAYRKRPRVLGELCVIEESSVSALVDVLVNPATRERAVDQVILHGGMTD